MPPRVLCEYCPDFEDNPLWHSAAMSKPAYLEMQTLTVQQLQPGDVGKPDAFGVRSLKRIRLLH
jgi:hypothetical protein